MIYLDANATAKFSPKVAAYISGEMAHDWVNPSSPHSLGLSGDTKIVLARQNIAEFFGCFPSQVFFNSGATESINTALNPNLLRSLGVSQIVSSKIEHSATLSCLSRLASEGFSVKWIGCDQNGSLRLDDLHAVLKNKKSLVSLMHVNNETGLINDVSEIVSIVRSQGSFVHIDASQALGKVKIDLDSLGAHLVSFSGHKVGSLKGIGMLYSSNDIPQVALIGDSYQRNGARAGTPNVAAVRSLELAIEEIDLKQTQKIQMLRDGFESALKHRFPQISINSARGPRVANTSNICFFGTQSQEILFYLSSREIYASNGSACNSGALDPSHVITGMGFEREYAQSCVRFSLGAHSTQDEMETVLTVITDFFNERNSNINGTSAELE